ncbi:Ankyrin repeat domain containing protein [Pandoravirus salinus]|uniref:Ankyrin repeat domain containing protein n=1 Tax=Pandoravirus salinus TaxID=1349410 RepID=S4W425_9VIRU|nr:ankyrin repeat domain [Pandoravirus salinus]AGO85060.1 Ankyrin repeat domain containing protein [Pandoravirus salinus]
MARPPAETARGRYAGQWPLRASAPKEEKGKKKERKKSIKQARSLRMDALPAELVATIVSRLGDRDFCRARAAHRCFHVDSPAGVAKRLAPWRDRKTPEAFCAVGLVEALVVLAERHVPMGPPCVWAAVEHGHLGVLRFLVDNGVSLKVPPRRRMRHIGRVPAPGAPTKQYADLIATAATAGRIDMMLFLEANGAPLIPGWAAIEGAARGGHVDALTWLSRPNVRHVYTATPKAMDEAAIAGHLDAVRFLHENRTEGCTTAAMDGAAAGGHLAIVIYLHTHRIEGCTKAALTSAASNGHLDVVRWLHANRAEGCYESAALLAHANGHRAVTQYICAQGIGLDVRSPNLSNILLTACINGAVDVLDWAWRQYPTILCADHVGTVLWSGAVSKANSDAMRWLHEADVKGCTKAIGDGLARMGDLDALVWLHGCRPDAVGKSAMGAAAAGGHVRVVSWLRDTVGTGDGPTAVVNIAARHGHLALIQHMCDAADAVLTTAAMDRAAGHGHLEVVQWLHVHRTEGCTTAAMDKAAARGHLEVVQWLHAHRTEGCTTAAMDGAAAHGHLAVVQWLHENRTEGCTTGAMDGAAGHGHLEVVQWLHENRTEGCTTDAMDDAAAASFAQVVEWLHAHRTEGCTERAANASYAGIRRFVLDNRPADCRRPARPRDTIAVDWIWSHD